MGNISLKYDTKEIKYPKIQSIFKRDKKGKMLFGKYSNTELETLKSLKWDVTEKIDGTNVRIIFDPEKRDIEIRGRNDYSQMSTSLYKRLKEIFIYDKLAAVFSSKVILFGEGYGAGINRGGCYTQNKEFILFDVFINGWWFEYNKVKEFAENIGIEAVPFLGKMSLDEIWLYVSNKPLSFIAKDTVMEGVVATISPMMLYRNRSPIKTKLKVRDFK